jgi:hypothetical protein
VVETVAAAARAARRGLRRPGPAPAAATRATVVDAGALATEADAQRWLERAAAGGPEVAAALAVLVAAVAAHRVAARDPALADPDPRRALAARVGYGTGDAVAAGRWETARDLHSGRREGGEVDPAAQERLSALLAGRDAVLACEELVLRARGDAAHGRPREAALQLEAALATALAELAAWRGVAGMPARLEGLQGDRAAVAAAAEAARQGRLDGAHGTAVDAALRRLEAALAARASAALVADRRG